MMKQVWVLLFGIYFCSVKSRVFPLQNEVHCPTKIIMSTQEQNGLSKDPTRQEFRNDAPFPVNIYWFDPRTRIETLQGVLAPKGEIRISTFLGDRFIVRSHTDEDSILLDLVVGVHPITLPEDLICNPESSAISNPRKERESGPLTPSSSLRGWISASKCDLVGSWVMFNDTGTACQEFGERWMVDLTAWRSTPHFEVTYLSHLFRFYLISNIDAAKILVKEFMVQPVLITPCSHPSQHVAVVLHEAIKAAAFVAIPADNHLAFSSLQKNPQPHDKNTSVSNFKQEPPLLPFSISLHAASSPQYAVLV